MLIAIEGLDGVGKTTTAKLLAKELGYSYFSKGFHLMMDASGKYDNFSTLNELALPNRKITSSYGCRSSFVYCKMRDFDIVTERYFCTNYATKPTYSTLKSIDFCIKLIGKPALTCILYCDYDTNFNRMYKRDPNDKDFPKLERQKEFYDNLLKCAKIFKLPFLFLDTTNLSIAEVVDRIIFEINQIKMQSSYKQIDFAANEIYDIKDNTIVFKKNYNKDCIKTSDKITKLIIEDNVSYVNHRLFDQFHDLTRIEVSPNNLFFSSINGILFDKNLEICIRVPIAYSSRTISLPKSVKSIGHNAFKYCKAQNIILSDSCTYIGYFSFLDCKQLKKIIIPNVLCHIGKNCFVGCNNLKGFFINTSNKLIHKGKSSKVLKLNIDEISCWAMCENLSIKKVIFSIRLRKIGAYAFAYSSVNEVIINSYVELHEYSFWHCFSLEKVIFKTYDAPRVAHNVFYQCPRPIKIIFPKGYNEQFAYAFRNSSDNVDLLEI